MRKSYFKCEVNRIWLICMFLSILIFWVFSNTTDSMNLAGLGVMLTYTGGVGLIAFIISSVNRIRKHLWLDELCQQSKIEVVKTISVGSCIIKLADGKTYTLHTWAWCPQYFPGTYTVRENNDWLDTLTTTRHRF